MKGRLAVLAALVLLPFLDVRCTFGSSSPRKDGSIFLNEGNKGQARAGIPAGEPFRFTLPDRP